MKLNTNLPSCNSCGTRIVYPDHYAFVIVQDLGERDRIPCAMRQNGMIAVVVEEAYAEYQLKTTETSSLCENSSWEIVDATLQDLNSVVREGNWAEKGMTGIEFFEGKEDKDFAQIGDIVVALEDYYDKEEVDLLLDDIDLSDYYTKTEVDDLLSNLPSGTPNLYEVLSEGNSANNLKITDLADGVDGGDAVNKSQLDALESPFEVIDVTQQIYTDKAINVKAFENQLHGTTYQEGAIDFGISRDNTHEMGMYSFKTGVNTIALGPYSSAFGYSTEAFGLTSSAFGRGTTASGNYSSAFGYSTEASGTASSAFGYNTEASGPYSSAFGSATTASGNYSSAFGGSTTASGPYSSASGNYTKALGDNSSAFGRNTTASGDDSSAFGSATTASGTASTAFGSNTEALGDISSAFGRGTTASGNYSSAFGYNAESSGYASSAFGFFSESNEYASLAIGRFSTTGIAETSWQIGSPIFKVGNGTGSNNRKNAYTLYNDGRSEQEKDMEVTTIGQGFVLKSPDGTRWRITVDNDGSLMTSELN